MIVNGATLALFLSIWLIGASAPFFALGALVFFLAGEPAKFMILTGFLFIGSGLAFFLVFVFLLFLSQRIKD